MNKDKVYCKDCKFCVTYPDLSRVCKHPNNIKVVDQYFEPVDHHITAPSVKNDNNDCQDYERRKTGYFFTVVKQLKAICTGGKK